MSITKIEMAGLVCRQYDQLPVETLPRQVMVLCHGFGANGKDLIGLGAEILSRQPKLAESVRFIFPEAPISLEDAGIPGGRAWWPLDIEKLVAAVEKNQFRDLRDESPPELPAVRQQLLELVEALCEANELDGSQMLLGGFSQGAMLATDVALRLPVSPKMLCVLSGTLLCESEWETLAEQRGALTVFQSHGRQDPVLPFVAAEWLRDLLTAAELDIDFHSFAGLHTIPLEIVDRLADRLAEVCGDA